VFGHLGKTEYLLHEKLSYFFRYDNVKNPIKDSHFSLIVDGSSLYYVNHLGIYLFKDYKLIQWKRHDRGGVNKFAKVSKDFFILGSDFRKWRPKNLTTLYDKKSLDLVKFIEVEHHICMADPKNDLIFVNVRPSRLDNNVSLYKFDANSLNIESFASFSSSAECPKMEESSVAQNSSMIVAACWDSPGVRYIAAYHVENQLIQWQKVISSEPPGDAEKPRNQFVQVLLTEKYACIYIEQQVQVL